MFDISMLMQKVATLAPEWDPFPLLQQLDAPTGQLPGTEALAAGGGMSDWMNPQQTPIPGDPGKIQTGPMAGAGLPVPPAAKGLAPFSPQQAAALAAMQGQGQQQRPMQAPAVAPQGPGKVGQMQQLTVPGVGRPIPGLAQILSGGR